VIQLPYRVALDSNFLFLPLTLRLDIFSETERLLPGRAQFIVIKPIREEIERLSSRSSQLGRNAKFALSLLSKCEEVDDEVKAAGTVDDALVNYARRHRVIVATTDRRLRKRLRDINVPVIYLRGRSRLELEGFPVGED
jgi:rRNA-processing protein FCF1